MDKFANIADGDVEGLTSAIGDKANVAMVMEKMREDSSLMPAALKMFKEDQNIRYRMMTTADKIKRKDGHGQRNFSGQMKPSAVADNNKRGMLQRDQKKMSKHYVEGQRNAVMILQNGKKSTVAYTRDELSDEKYSVEGVYINDVPFFIISFESAVNDKVNTQATKAMNLWVDDVQVTCHGHVAFMRTNDDWEFIDTTVDKFLAITGLSK